MNLSEGDKIILHFGTWNKEVEIGYSVDLEVNTLGCFTSFTILLHGT